MLPIHYLGSMYSIVRSLFLFFCCPSLGSFFPLPDFCFFNRRKKCQHRNSVIGQRAGFRKKIVKHCAFLPFHDSFCQSIQGFHKFLFGTAISPNYCITDIAIKKQPHLNRSLWSGDALSIIRRIWGFIPSAVVFLHNKTTEIL